jgi:hypothetical protein
MPVLIALAASVGVLAVAATWLFLGFAPAVTANLQVWQAFIAWGCFFQSGGKLVGARTAALCMSFGAVVGLAAVLLAHQLGPLGQFAAPLAVGIGATVIVLASKVPMLETIPASVYGFAAIAGLILLKPGMGDTPVNALVPTIVSVLIGTAFGYVSEVVAGALTKKSLAAVNAEASPAS